MIICLKILVITILSWSFCSSFKIKNELCAVRQNNNDSDTVIIWNENQKLNFNDFKGKYSSDIGGDGDAYIDYTIEYDSWQVKKSTIMFYVSCKFFKYYSSMIIHDSAVLKHEQLHFDIGEKYARFLRRSLLSLNYLDNKTYAEQLKDSLSRYSILCKSEQDKFDERTSHSLNSQGEEKWRLKILSELNRLKNYSNKLIVINLY